MAYVCIYLGTEARSSIYNCIAFVQALFLKHGDVSTMFYLLCSMFIVPFIVHCLPMHHLNINELNMMDKNKLLIIFSTLIFT